MQDLHRLQIEHVDLGLEHRSQPAPHDSTQTRGVNTGQAKHPPRLVELDVENGADKVQLAQVLQTCIWLKVSNNPEKQASCLLGARVEQTDAARRERCLLARANLKHRGVNAGARARVASSSERRTSVIRLVLKSISTMPMPPSAARRDAGEQPQSTERARTGFVALHERIARVDAVPAPRGNGNAARPGFTEHLSTAMASAPSKPAELVESGRQQGRLAAVVGHGRVFKVGGCKTNRERLVCTIQGPPDKSRLNDSQHAPLRTHHTRGTTLGHTEPTQTTRIENLKDGWVICGGRVNTMDTCILVELDSV